MSLLSALYAAVVRRRREYYASRPHLRRRLRHPVVSVGNLAVGGRGKTPLAASIARILRDAGERPAILSRGYGRTRPEDGVVVVRDAHGMRADLPRAGDEPLMLARQLPGVCVLSCPDRYLAGRLAEHSLGATVHVLDDGFQHLQLDRDVDLVIVAREDIERPLPLPHGRLREPLDTLVAADAILTADGVAVDAGPEVPVFGLRRTGSFTPPPALAQAPVVAAAGIANPPRFFDDLRQGGWQVAETMAFPDHHPYAERDVARIEAAVRRTRAAALVTTEKDHVRLLPFRPLGFAVVPVGIVLDPEPLDRFRAWLADQLRSVRGEIGG